MFKSIQNLEDDWKTVLIGLLMVGLLLIFPQLPQFSFSWKSNNDLLGLFSQKYALMLITTFSIGLFVVFLISVLNKIPTKEQVFCYLLVFTLTILSIILSGNDKAKNLNLETVIFCLCNGLLIGNIFKLPEWLIKSLNSELLVKIGLIILGTNIIFSDILKAGGLGVIQSLVVVLSVWYFSFFLGKILGVDDEMRVMLSSAVSICGVSAAIASAGAIKGDNKKLSYVVTLVLVTAIPMMLFMPYLAQKLGLSEIVAGAWMGGSIDTTGAVVASGSQLGEEALKISTIVKFSQNVLLGFAALAISFYWSFRSSDAEKKKIDFHVIWSRFPKFVLGFFFVSLVFSFVVPNEYVNASKTSYKSLQNLFFALAFTSIGLETKFKDFFKKEYKTSLITFLIAQAFNVAVTLIMALILFGN